MARPIPFDAAPRDPRVELQHRLDRAPIEHAEALLARGLIGSGEKVLEIVTEEANAPEATRALRNGILLFNVLGGIDPDTLKKFTQPIPQAIQVASLQAESPGLWALMKSSIFSRDFRRGLAAMIGILRGIGIALAKDGS